MWRNLENKVYFELGKAYGPSNRGFTLIEVLIAVVVLSVCLVVIMELFSGALRSSNVSSQYIQAVYKAREKMEEILSLPTLSRSRSSGESQDGFRWEVEIEPLAEDETDFFSYKKYVMFRIKVDVSWKDSMKERHFSISTFQIAKEGESEGS